MDHKRLTLFAGHYGSGKTNIALNWACWLRAQGLPITVADLDIVNPYFRTKDAEGMLAEAHRICALREKNMCVKIPVTVEGMKAIKAAKADGLCVLATAIYSADQAFLAAMNGADYLAPYVNRMENLGDGVGQALDLLQMLAGSGLEAKVIAASFKNVYQVHQLIAAGIQAVTLPPDIAWAMVKHPSTQIAVDEFNDAWEAAFGRRSF